MTPLERAIRAMREGVGDQTLSSATRAAILRRSLESSGAGSLAERLPTSLRLALAGALPIALALTFVVLAGRGRETADPSVADPIVHKVDGRVVFEVAAGTTITRSEVPFAFDARAAVRAEHGRYADRIGAGPRLVFYKIE